MFYLANAAVKRFSKKLSSTIGASGRGMEGHDAFKE
jgi:hypothetical protein